LRSLRAVRQAGELPALRTLLRAIDRLVLGQARTRARAYLHT
jgi:hypothetical protein